MLPLSHSINLQKNNYYQHCDFFESKERLSGPTFLNQILYANSVRALFPFQLHFTGIASSYLLIFGRKGRGSLTCCQEKYEIHENEVLLLSSTAAHHFSINDCRQWNFIYLYLNSELLKHLFEFYQINRLHFSVDAVLENLLLQVTLPSFSLLSPLQVHLFMTQLLCRCIEIHERKSNPSPALPNYLKEIRKRFHHHCEEVYRLDDLAIEYSISKTKLIRDFHEYIGESPISYLTQIRIQRAKELLETTTYPIQSIASIVGLANVNHFIHLFKKNIGATPLQYRKDHHTD